MTHSLVNIERREGGVALVELNRPEKRALFPLMEDEARTLRERVLGRTAS